jgi:hypothetical protein
MKKSLILLAVAGLTASAMAQNSGFRLTDGTAVYEVTSGGTSGTIPTTSEPTGTSAGVQANFRINGGTSGTDNLYANWWWYRTGASTRELAVRQTTGTAVRSSTGANNVSYAITTTAALSFNLSWTLNQLDANTAVITYTATATNTSTADIAGFSMFNYADYFINGADASDRVTSTFAGSPARIINMDDSTTPAWGMTHRGTGANGFIVGTFAGVGGQITDTSIDNFTDTNSGAPVFPALGTDISGIMQWNFGDLRAGSSVTATASIVAWNVVPTPGAAALAGLGLLAAGRRRR